MQATVVLVIFACACRLLFARYTGLGIDESYMVAASNQFAASYFDHPLASWWLELAARALFGAQTPIVVRLPFVMLSALSSALLFLLTKRLYGEAAGFWAVFAYTLSPVFSLAFGCWVLPDGPLDAALLATAYALTRALGLPAKPDPRWWLAAGTLAGLALLSKYSAGLIIAGALLFAMTDATGRAQLRTPWPWAAALIAAALFTPVIWWNATHGWQSFHYQSGRAVGLRLHPLAPFTIWGGEALFVLPWIWLPMVVLLISALRRGPAERLGWFLALLAVLPITLFSVVGVWSATRILYHWATPGYLLLFPLLGNWLAGWRPGWRNLVTSFTASLMLTLPASIIFLENRPLPAQTAMLFKPGQSPLLQAVDWTSLASQMPPGVQVVAAQRWYDAGKVSYGLAGALPVTVFGPEPHEFGLTSPPAAFLGDDVLILAMPGSESESYQHFAPDFKVLAPGPALVVANQGDILLVIPTLLGQDMLRTP